MGCGASNQNGDSSVGPIQSPKTGKGNGKKGPAKFQLDTELLNLLVKNATTSDNKQHKEILDLFGKVDAWEFDLASLSKLTAQHPLVYVVASLLKQHDLYQQLNLDKDQIVTFLMTISDKFPAPFHSNELAADIAQGFHCIIKRGLKKYLNDEDIFAAIIASTICHLGHPGLSSEYQESSESFASTLYNARSILQYRSVAHAFDIIQNGEKCNIFANLRPEKVSYIREAIILMILATEKSNQAEVLSKFIPKVSDTNQNEFSDPGDKELLLQVIMILAHKSYMSVRRISTHLYWMEKYFTEKFTQGDLEAKKGYPVTPGCTRDGKVKEEVLEEMKSLMDVLQAYYKLEPRIKTSRQILKANIGWWKNVHGTEEADGKFADFSKGYTWDEAEETSDALDKLMISEVEPTTGHEKVIDLKIQNANRLHQSKLQENLETACRDTLIKVFEKPESVDWSQLNIVPPVYALVDFAALDNPLTNSETQQSVLSMFSRLDAWDFDVFALTRMLGGEALYLTSFVLFHKYEIPKKFKIPIPALQNFLKKVQAGYQMNPYHNAMHACDVMQITNSIMVQGNMMAKMGSIDIFAALLSAMVHDYDHPGLNNAFQVHSSSYLARIYNDRSVLENHHCSSAFQIIRHGEGCDILQNMDPETKKDARETIVSMILSTDMTNHVKYFRKFKSRVEAGSDFTSKKDIRTALEIAIKMSDVSNPSRPLYLYLQWTKKIINEFFMQGDKERQYNLPVSPLMDRERSVLSKGQKAFMDFVITPMFKSFAGVFPGMSFCLDLIDTNYNHWAEHKEIEDAQFDPKEYKTKRLAKWKEAPSKVDLVKEVVGETKKDAPAPSSEEAKEEESKEDEVKAPEVEA